MRSVSIPGPWEDVGPTWFAEVFPDAVVSKATLVLVDDGTNRRACFALSYASGTGPTTVFVKASDPAHAALNDATGGVLNEARFFAGGTEVPVDHPEVFAVGIDESALDFVMVMEDLAGRSADPRDATRPLSVDEAAAGVRGLARLHSAFWGPRIDQHPELAWIEAYAVWGRMTKPIRWGLEKAAHVLPPAVATLSVEELETTHWHAFIGTLGSGAQTLLHGDAHVGNTYVLPDGSMGFLDWQVLRRGNPSVDLGYFLQGAITVEDLRAHGRDLVEEWRTTLDVPDRPDPEDTWDRFCASTIHGLTLWLATAAGTWQRPEVSFALVERYANAFVDLDTPGALARLRT